MKNQISLAQKNRIDHPNEFEKLRSKMIEDRIRLHADKSGVREYPSENAELAILRKQILKIVEALKENGITAETEEFSKLNQTIFEIKTYVDQILEY